MYTECDEVRTHTHTWMTRPCPCTGRECGGWLGLAWHCHRGRTEGGAIAGAPLVGHLELLCKYQS